MIWISARPCLNEWLSDRVTDMLLVDTSVMMLTGSINILYKDYNTAGMMNLGVVFDNTQPEWVTEWHTCRIYFCDDMMDLGLWRLQRCRLRWRVIFGTMELFESWNYFYILWWRVFFFSTKLFLNYYTCV